jgi:hypothetical protein
VELISLARHVRTSAFPFLVKAGITARTLNPSAIVVLVLTLAWLSLLLTAPANGDFWWADAPRHAINGAFVKDFVAAHPIDDPVQWAINYYLMRPALTIMFYPPLFYGVEAIAFALFGVSHFVAQFTVSLFVLLLAVSVYTLSRMCLPRWSALGAALLAIGSPEAALWGRQVMLDLPAYALIVASACCLTRYLRDGRPLSIYLTALFLLAAIYTKYNAGFVAPALIAVLLIAKGRRVLGDRHEIVAGALTVFGLLPAIFILFKFGAVNRDSVSGLEGTLPLNSLACWLFYIEALPSQLGVLTVVLGAGGLALIVTQIAKRRDHQVFGLLLAWVVAGYLFFTLIGLKETRHTIMVLLPLAIAAPLLLLAILPKPVGELAGFALGAGTLAYTLIFWPVPRVEGYADIALYLAKNVPRNGVVLYSGYRDANLIFDLATNRDRSDISVVRADKLLLSAPVGERRRGVRQADYDLATIARMLRELGAAYFVVQPDFWSDLTIMDRFDNVINGPDYEKVAHFGLTGNLSTQDGTQGIDILRPTYPVAEHSGKISIDMPLAGQRFDGAIHP